MNPGSTSTRSRRRSSSPRRSSSSSSRTSSSSTAQRFQTPQLATIGVLAAMVPVVTLAIDGGTRRMFGGAFVVDPYSLAFKGFFLAAAYVTLLLSVDYIGEGDYYQGEFYFLLLTSVLGMVVMASARDLITIFVALETISIPTFVLAGWRKHDTKSNEASIKYYLIGVLSSAVMLYGMSFIFGFSGSTLLADIAVAVAARPRRPSLLVVAIFLTLVGFAFKISAVPVPLLGARHLRGRAHSGHRVPLGVVEGRRLRRAAHDRLRRVLPVPDSWQPVLWVLAALSMTLGQPRRAAPDQHRPDAGLLVDRAGRVHPRAARGRGRRRRGAARRSRRSSSTSSSTAR